MFLAQVRIENFRAIQSIDLPLDEVTTLLLGENGCGKTSLFGALHACLGIRRSGAELAFARRDFRPPPDAAAGQRIEPIRVTLRFEEREPGEWEPHVAILGPAMRLVAEGRRTLKWEVRSVWDAEADTARCHCIFLDASGEPIPGLDENRLSTEVRRLSPFLSLLNEHRYLPSTQAGELASADDYLASGRFASGSIEEFTRGFYGKLSGGWEDLSPKDMRRARAAAKRIWRRLVHPHRTDRPNSGSYRLPSGGAQSLGPLLVFGALLQARGARPLDPDVDPILAAEHIGAHLHPATLGSVRKVLESLPVQKLISTYSPEIVSAMPLHCLRRMVRRRHGVDVYRFHESRLDPDDRRRLAYHIRARRGGALFDRCWLLVEGETEFWLIPEMARLRGYELDAEGVSIVEFAQCGVRPILELARDLNINWRLLADGDDAGEAYASAASGFLNGRPYEDHITRLPFGDMEHYLWSAGYQEVYLKAANFSPRKGRRYRDRKSVINRAVSLKSKPFLALSVIDACAEEGSPGVPPVLRGVIDSAVHLARAN